MKAIRDPETTADADVLPWETPRVDVLEVAELCGRWNGGERTLCFVPIRSGPTTTGPAVMRRISGNTPDAPVHRPVDCESPYYYPEYQDPTYVPTFNSPYISN